jgi:WD40 repeat protein
LTVASVKDATIRVWNMNGRPNQKKPELAYVINQSFNSSYEDAVSKFLPLTSVGKGNYLVTGANNGEVKIYDLWKQGKLLTAFNSSNGGHSERIRGLVEIKSLNLLATCSEDKTIKVWDLNSFNLKFTLKDHSKAVLNIIHLESNDYLVSIGSDYLIKVWDIDSQDGLSGYTLISTQYHITSETSSGFRYTNIDDIVSLNNGNYFATGGGFCLIKLWNKKGVLYGTLTHTCESGRSVNIVNEMENGYLASASSDGSIEIWDWMLKQRKFRFSSLSTGQGPSWYFGSPLVSLNDGLMASNTDATKSIIIWDITQGKKVSTLSGHSSYIRSLIRVDYDGNNFLASGSGSSPDKEQAVRIWKL